MSNPFLINPYNNAYTQGVSAASNPYIGGGQTGGISGNPNAGQISKPEGGIKTGPTHQQDLNEVSIIGAQKREGFENGLGGTNNPDDHKLFLVA
ncbi:MAG: hypothetical protein Q4F80_05525 [bacterium]|nr:hypothetical protein [bacterium]